MTTIAAFRDSGGAVAIATDLAVTGPAIQFHVETKMARVGPFLVAWSGLPMVGRFLATTSVDRVELLASSLVAWMTARGHGKQDPDGDMYINASLVVVRADGEEPSGPWIVTADGSVLCPTEGYVSCGTGQELAYGAMHLARRLEWSAFGAVKGALLAAGYHDPYTDGLVAVDVTQPVFCEKCDWSGVAGQCWTPSLGDLCPQCRGAFSITEA